MIDERATTDWSLQLVMAVVTIVLILQNTKKALLPAKQTPVLWGAEAAVIACVLVLRSGWGRDSSWAEAQGELGTLANNFYEPRRDALLNGGAIAGGVFGALWWATATWGVLFTAMRRGVPTAGLIDFIVAAVVGAITGALVGAVGGLAAGHVWERRHRRQRLARHTRHA
ncbi:MAG TPA: hypothetical protein VII52_04180 [Gemmatimonadaceae bacterium]